MGTSLFERYQAETKQPSLYAQYQASQKKKASPLDANNQATPDELAAAGGDDEQPGILGSIADATQGIPGVAALQAGARSVARGQPYRDAYSDIRRQTDKVPATAKMVGRMATSSPLAMFLPGGVVAGGAALGAAEGALDADPNVTARGRALNAALGAGAGATVGAAIKGAGNLATRSGLTDKLGSALRTIGRDARQTRQSPALQQAGQHVSDFGESIGTTGAANKLLTDRQTVLDQLSGSEKSAAQNMIDHIDGYKSQARDLYDTAKQDNAVVNDKRVRAVLADGRVQQMFQVARERLGLGPNETVVQPAQKEVLRLTAGAPRSPTPPVPSGAPQSTREAIRAFEARRVAALNRTEGTTAQQQARAALERREAEAALPTPPPRAREAVLSDDPRPAVDEITVDLPTPEELAMTKRLLNQVVQQKFNAPQGISSAEAAQMAPLLDDLRAALHETSPAWKEADTFYAQAKNFEDAFQRGYGAQQKPSATGINPKLMRSPEAIARWIDKGKGTPVGIARASGSQAGAAGRLGESVRNAPLGSSIGEILSSANGVFQPSASAASLRRTAFGSDGDASAFTGTLGKLLRESGEPRGPQSVPLLKPWQALRPRNELATPAGAELRMNLSGALADPSKASALREALAAAERGRSSHDLLRKLGLLGVNSSRPR